MAVVVETTGGDDAVGVGMEAQVAGPSVQHGRDAELCVQTISTEVEQGAGGRLEHEVVHFFGTCARKGAKLAGQREDDVKVFGGNDPLTALLEPPGLRETLALGAVAIAARVVSGRLVSALSADVQMPAQRGGSATLDRCHHFALYERRDVLVPIDLTRGAKDFCHLETRPPLPVGGRARRSHGALSVCGAR